MAFKSIISLLSAQLLKTASAVLYAANSQQRQRLLQEAETFVQDARNYHALCRLISDIQEVVVQSLRFRTQTDRTKTCSTLITVFVRSKTPRSSRDKMSISLFFLQYGIRILLKLQ